MKAILIRDPDTLISLENMKCATVRQRGSGTNVEYYVRVEYYGNEFADTPYTKGKGEAEYWLAEMRDIYTAE